MLFEFRNLTYQYPDGTLGLSDVTGSIDEGEQIAILGENGCGKSTLLRVMNGLIEPTSGSVWFDGTVLTERTLSDPRTQMRFRSRVAFVFQDADAQLFNATVAEELGFGPSQLGLSSKQVQTRVDEMLEFLGISHLADRAPFRLSGGEKRKVAIGSVLAMNPEVILFDEPFVGLDPKSQGWLIETLNSLREAGKTAVVATHSLDNLRLFADRALVISEDHELIGSMPVSEMYFRDQFLLDSCSFVEPELQVLN